MPTFVAVDLGASSGRVMTVRIGGGRLDVGRTHRFVNRPVRTNGTLRWDLPALYRGVLDGLAGVGAGDAERPVSIGVDSWGVDYGLLDATGRLLADPVHHRDARTRGMIERAATRVPAARMYATTGVQRLPINTVYQLMAEDDAELDRAATLLLVPDLLIYRLTGTIGAEVTNASTTGLLDVHTREWARDLTRRLAVPDRLLPPLRRPGERAGPLRAGVAAATGLAERTGVVTVGSHDTASAVVAVPAAGERFGYVSCGTWALAGVELDRPVLTEAGRAANFTNEAGVDQTVRYLRNVMGLWILQECLRTWRDTGRPHDLAELLRAADRVPAFDAVVNPDDSRFLPPGDMPARIAAYCRETGQRPPADPAAVVRCVLESLAVAFRATIRAAERLADHPVDAVHLVGGGARNEPLCRFTADACGLPVVAGPVEATALGNACVQARAHRSVGDLTGIRALIAETQPLRRYAPAGGTARWSAAAARIGLE